MAFAQWLSNELRRREWTQADFARQAKLSTATVHYWVSGKRVPDPTSCDLIADALMLPLDDVLSAAGHRPRQRLTADDAGEAMAELARRVRWTGDRRAGIEALMRQWIEEDRRREQRND